MIDRILKALVAVPRALLTDPSEDKHVDDRGSRAADIVEAFSKGYACGYRTAVEDWKKFLKEDGEAE